ncbi:MAG TPA: 7TM diverse intracellular signaling domain-containing protein [Ferruginibacter sp.]|nr:7TM diverse intracellular signaling domain-containing protein [Ferruginibacter sp.]
MVILFFESVGIFMCLYFLLQFIILRKSEYLYYSIYLLLLVLYYMCATPEVFSFNNNPSIVATLEILKRPIQFLISVFYTLFIIHYLNLEKQSRPLYRIFRILLALYLVFSFICLFANIFKLPYDTAYYLGSMVLFPVQLYMVTALFKYKVPYGKFVIWGSINVIIGSIFTLLLGIQNAKYPTGFVSNAGSYIPVIICILTDIFLFTIALQRKIADNEKSLINVALARQQAIANERERIIADLHDDVGGGLSSIRMWSDLMVLKEGNNPTIEEAGFASKISATAKDISQRMNTIIWSLNTENDTVQNFAEYVRQHGVNFFENSTILFQYYLDAHIPKDLTLSGRQRKNLFLIAKESLHNILKHSGGNMAEVSIDYNNQYLSLTIKDNGMGLQNGNTFGNGLKNMQKRMSEIKGSFDIHSNNGTVIQVSVPL